MMQAMVGASNKAFDYLACGRALVVWKLPGWKTMFVEPGYGFACVPDDPCSIEHALRRLLITPAKFAPWVRGRQRIGREWICETQFEEFAEYIQLWESHGPLSGLIGLHVL
jgi:hypothetical protein